MRNGLQLARISAWMLWVSTGVVSCGLWESTPPQNGDLPCVDADCPDVEPACEEPCPVEPLPLSPRELSSGHEVSGARARLEALQDPFVENRIVPKADGVFFSTDDRLFILRDGETRRIEEVGGGIFPSDGGVVSFNYFNPSSPEPGQPILSGVTTLREVTLDGTVSEVLRVEGREPGTVVKAAEDVYFTLTPGELFALSSVNEKIRDVPNGVPLAWDQGRFYWTETGETAELVEWSSGPEGETARLELPSSLSFIQGCGGTLLALGSDLLSIDVGSAAVSVLAPRGESALGEVIEDLVISVACNSWGYAWVTLSAGDAGSRLWFQRKGTAKPIELAPTTDLWAIALSEEEIFWLTPGDGDASLYSAELAPLLAAD